MIIEKGIEKNIRFSIYIDENLVLQYFERILNKNFMKEICIMPNCKDYNYMIALITNLHNLTIISRYQRFVAIMLQKPRNVGRNAFDDICSVKRSNIYFSMICRKLNNIYLFRMENNDVIEEIIPGAITSIYNELKEYVTMYGSIKASDFVKYIARKYGYSREEAIKIIREAIDLGIIRYDYGCLSPGIEIE